MRTAALGFLFTGLASRAASCFTAAFPRQVNRLLPRSYCKLADGGDVAWRKPPRTGSSWLHAMEQLQEPTEKLKDVIAIADEQVKAGDLLGAITRYETALTNMGRSGNLKTVAGMKLFMKTADAQIEAGDFSRAQKHYLKAGNVLQLFGRTNTMDHAGLLMKMGAAKQGMGNLETAIISYEKARGVIRMCGKEGSLQDARVLNKMGMCRAEQGDLEGAVRDHNIAKRALEQSNAMESPEALELLFNAGTVNLWLNKGRDALKDFTQAKYHMRKTGNINTVKGGRLLSLIADAHFIADDPLQALECLDDAANVLYKMGVLESRGGAKLLAKRAHALTQLDRPQEALQESHEVLGIFNRTNSIFTQAGADFLLEYGSLEAQYGDLDDGLKHMMLAMRFYEMPDEKRKLQSFKAILLMERIGDLMTFKDEWSRALHFYKQAKVHLAKMDETGSILPATADSATLEEKIAGATSRIRRQSQELLDNIEVPEEVKEAVPDEERTLLDLFKAFKVDSKGRVMSAPNQPKPKEGPLLLPQGSKTGKELLAEKRKKRPFRHKQLEQLKADILRDRGLDLEDEDEERPAPAMEMSKEEQEAVRKQQRKERNRQMKDALRQKIVVDGEERELNVELKQKLMRNKSRRHTGKRRRPRRQVREPVS